jgi:hypothetical protein
MGKEDRIYMPYSLLLHMVTSNADVAFSDVSKQRYETGVLLIGARVLNCIADLPLHSSQLKMSRLYDLPKPGTRDQGVQDRCMHLCFAYTTVRKRRNIQADCISEAGS